MEWGEGIKIVILASWMKGSFLDILIEILKNKGSLKFGFDNKK